MDIEREIKDLEKISLNKSRNMDEREAAAIKLMRLRAKHNTKSRNADNNRNKNTKKNRRNNAQNKSKNKNTKHKNNTKRSRKWNVPNTDSYKAQRGLH